MTTVRKLANDFREWQKSWELYDKDPKNKNKPKSFDEFIQPYLAMEKEQIIDAHIEGQRVFDKHDHTQWTTDQAEQYYNETYKNK